MGFPTTPVLDDFIAPDEAPISQGGDWTTATAWWTDGLALTSNHLTTYNGVGPYFGGSIWKDQFTDPFEIYITLDVLPPSPDDYIGFEMFVQKTDVSAAPDGYGIGILQQGADSFRFRLGRYDAGTPAGIDIIDESIGLQVGDVVGLTYTAGKFAAWLVRSGAITKVGSGTDLTYAAPFWITVNADDSHGGSPGLVQMTDFGGGSTVLPPNLSAGTAIALDPLPQTVTQDVQAGSLTYTVWYTFTAPITGVANVFPFGALSGYTPQLTVKVNGGIDIYRNIANYPERPTEFPVTAGEQYWLQIVAPAGNPFPADLRVQVQMFVPLPTPASTIFINDETTANFPASIIDASSGVVTSFVLDFPGGEQMVQLADGTLFLQDVDNARYDIYTAQRVFVTSVAIFNNIHISSNRLNRFYAGNSATDTITVYSPDGALVSSFVVTGHPVSLAPSRTDSVLYYANGTAGAAINRWDIPGNAALSDLAAGVSGYIIKEIFVLADETILVIYRRTAPYDVYIVRYDPAGTTLNTYDTQLDASTTGDTHLAFTQADPTTFAVWIKIGNGVSRIMTIDTASGAILTSFDRIDFTAGRYNGPTTADPTQFFGFSESCTFVLSAGCPGRRSGEQIGA